MAYDSGEEYNPSSVSTRKEPEWKIRLGKAIFWSTVAFAVCRARNTLAGLI